MIPITVYVSARYEDRQKARELRALLECYRDVRVKSSWLDGPDQPMSSLGGEQAFKAATSDIEEIGQADVFVRLNPVGGDRSGTGGRHVEFGIALAFGLPVVLVGERMNVFDYLTGVLLVGPQESVISVVRKAAAFTLGDR